MGRSGKAKGKNISKDVDMLPGEVVISAVGEQQQQQQIASLPNTNSTCPQEGQGKGKGDKKMPFVAFDKAKLVVKYPTTVGRSGKPSVAVGGNARLQFSTEVSKAFDGCKVVSPSFEKDTNKLRLEGMANAPKGKENAVWDIVRAKETSKNKSKTVSISGALLLKEVGYDYKAAGNQTFDVDKQDNDKHVVIFTLPKETPKPKPVVARKKKETPAGKGAAANSAPAAPAAEEEEQLVIEE